MKNPLSIRVLLPAVIAGALVAPATAAAADPPNGIINTFAGLPGTPGFSGDGGPATAAALNAPQDVSVLPDGSVLVADTSNNRIRKVATNGTISTVAGSGVACGGGACGDTGPATSAQLNGPEGVAATPDGGFLIVDSNDARVRRVFPDGHIDAAAGTGAVCAVAPCGDGGNATSAQFVFPVNVLVRPDGSYLVSDIGLVANVVRRIDTAGPPQISKVAGTYGVQGASGDGGPAIAAQLNNPYGLAGTPDGGYLIADSANQEVRKVSAGGTMSRVAGTGFPAAFGGDGGPATAAQLNAPVGVASTSDGGFFISDQGNNRIRAVGPNGIITTLAGNGTAGNAGDNGPAVQAQVGTPFGLALRNSTLFAADNSNADVRAVGLPPQPGGGGGTGSGNAPPTTPNGPASPPLLPPANVPPPVLGRSVVAQVISGTVRVRARGVRKFTPLTDPVNVPIGTEFDTKKGTVALFFATGVDDPHSVEVSTGLFRTRQTTKVGTALELDLTGHLKGCPRISRARAATALAARASTRQIAVKAKGRVKSKGRYGSAIVRGTAWTIRDTCNASRPGTLVSVTEGLVGVTDFAKRKTVLVARGKRYFAAASAK